MMDNLSPKQQRMLALALLVLAIATLWLVILQPISLYLSAGTEERQSALRTLKRDRALLLQEPRIRAALTSLEQSPRWGRFYDNHKPEQAVLQLETDLRTLFSSPNNLTSMTAEPATALGPLTQIAVKVTLSMPIDQLAEALSRLQQHSRLLRVDKLTIQAPDFQAEDSNPLLSIQAEVVGFLVTPTAARH